MPYGVVGNIQGGLAGIYTVEVQKFGREIITHRLGKFPHQPARWRREAVLILPPSLYLSLHLLP